MRLLVNLGASLLAGIALGSAYFLALWWTVQKLTAEGRAGAWIAASIVVRLMLVLGSFVLVVFWGGWQALVAALAGFVIARMVLVRRLPGPARQSGPSP